MKSFFQSFHVLILITIIFQLFKFFKIKLYRVVKRWLDKAISNTHVYLKFSCAFKQALSLFLDSVSKLLQAHITLTKIARPARWHIVFHAIITMRNNKLSFLIAPTRVTPSILRNKMVNLHILVLNALSTISTMPIVFVVYPKSVFFFHNR
nr:MAG TPA_asm: hypothetical protein [Caudoviricetes sp.]